MRVFCLMFAIVMSAPAFADYITCYDSGKSIYSNHVREVSYYDNLFSFLESKTGQYIITNANCIIKVPKGKK